MLWWTLQRLKSSKYLTRAEAATRLGASAQKKAVPALIRKLDDESAAVRVAVIDALAKLRHHASVAPLADSLGGLSRRSKGLKEGEEQVSQSVEYEALARALGALGAVAVPSLLRLLGSEVRETRRWAAHALGLARDSRAVEPLIKTLADSRSDVRKAAALALGTIGDSLALDPLVKTLASRDHETRRAAAVALGNIGSGRAVDALRAISEDPNEPVQLAVVDALRKIGGLRAGTVLRTIIDAGKKNVREAAETALSSLEFAPTSASERAAAAVLKGYFASAAGEGEAAVEALVDALGSKDADRRRQAAEALAMLRSPAAIDPLLRALKDHDLSVQSAACKALAGTGQAAVEGLSPMLSHHDSSVQRQAALALGDIGDPRAAAPLADAIEQNRALLREYPELLEAVRAAATALTAILTKSSSAVPAEVLDRVAEMPDAVSRSAAGGAREPAVDCGPIRELARQELHRRGA
jgi:HEAT repeat protein